MKLQQPAGTTERSMLAGLVVKRMGLEGPLAIAMPVIDSSNLDPLKARSLDFSEKAEGEGVESPLDLTAEIEGKLEAHRWCRTRVLFSDRQFLKGQLCVLEGEYGESAVEVLRRLTPEDRAPMCALVIVQQGTILSEPPRVERLSYGIRLMVIDLSFRASRAPGGDWFQDLIDEAWHASNRTAWLLAMVGQ